MIFEKHIIFLCDTYGQKFALQFESSQEINKAILRLKEAGYIKGINNKYNKFYTIEKKPFKKFVDSMHNIFKKK